jgi:polysaccharide biosynthesis/export protein
MPPLTRLTAVATLTLTLGLGLGFAQSSTQPPAYSRSAQQQDSAGTNLPAQKIGPNDLLAVSVYDAPEFSRTVRVGADGMIRLPMLKQRIHVEALMPAEAETAIANALRDEQLLTDPFVTVNVAEYQSRPISIAGAVRNPITFQATTGNVTLLEALTRAGGLTPDAGSAILVTKPQLNPSSGERTALTQRIAVKGLIDQADPTLNLILRGGEEIRVPESGKIYVVGAVKRSGSFPIEDGGSSVLKALAKAEGLGDYVSKVGYIYRQDLSGTKTEIPIAFKDIMTRKAPDVPLVENDILYIPVNEAGRTRAAVIKVLAGAGVAATGGLIWALAR